MVAVVEMAGVFTEYARKQIGNNKPSCPACTREENVSLEHNDPRAQHLFPAIFSHASRHQTIQAEQAQLKA